MISKSPKTVYVVESDAWTDTQSVRGVATTLEKAIELAKNHDLSKHATTWNREQLGQSTVIGGSWIEPQEIGAIKKHIIWIITTFEVA